MNRWFNLAAETSTQIVIATILSQEAIGGYPHLTAKGEVFLKGPAPPDSILEFIYPRSLPGQHPRVAPGNTVLVFLDSCTSPDTTYTYIGFTQCMGVVDEDSISFSSPDTTRSLTSTLLDISNRIQETSLAYRATSADAILRGTVVSTPWPAKNRANAARAGEFSINVSTVYKEPVEGTFSVGSDYAIQVGTFASRVAAGSGALPVLAVEDSVVVFLNETATQLRIQPGLSAAWTVDADSVHVRNIYSYCNRYLAKMSLADLETAIGYQQ